MMLSELGNLALVSATAIIGALVNNALSGTKRLRQDLDETRAALKEAQETIESERARRFDSEERRLAACDDCENRKKE